MKKKLLGMLLLIGAAGVVSCSKSDDMEVFVGDNFNKEAQVMKASLDTMSFPTVKDWNESMVSSPILLHMNADGFTKNNWGQNGRYYGYVDLGLSVKWATTNIGSMLDKNSNPQTWEEYYYDRIKDIKPVEKPIIAQAGHDKYPYVEPFDEYKKNAVSITTLRRQYEAYKSYCELMRNAFRSAVVSYNTYLMNYNSFNASHLDGTTIYWGSSDYAGVISGAPDNIAGDKDFDVCTRIGDGWQMPTKAQWEELTTKCKWEEHNAFYIITGPNGKSIVLPKDNNFGYLTSERVRDTKTNSWKYYKVDTKTKKVSLYADRSGFVRPVYTK